MHFQKGCKGTPFFIILAANVNRLQKVGEKEEIWKIFRPEDLSEIVWGANFFRNLMSEIWMSEIWQSEVFGN